MSVDSSATAATGSAKALVKGIAIVDLLASLEGGMRLGELATGMRLPRATVTRLLDALCEADLVQLDGDGTYRLGARCAIWGSQFLASIELRDLAGEVMTRLVQETNETCHLGIAHGRRVIYVHKVESAHSLRMFSRVGGMNPLHTTGVGKALLAHLPEDEQEEYLAGRLERRTANTIVDRDALREELRRIRAKGYAVDDVENELGVRCVGAPVFDHLGNVVASVSLAGPTMRMTWERIDELSGPLTAAANQISHRLGYGLQPRAGTGKAARAAGARGGRARREPSVGA